MTKFAMMLVSMLAVSQVFADEHNKEEKSEEVVEEENNKK